MKHIVCDYTFAVESKIGAYVVNWCRPVVPSSVDILYDNRLNSRAANSIV